MDTGELAIQNETNIKSVSKRQDRFETNIERRIGGVEDGVRDIRDNLLGRPTWVQLTIISLLCGACTGLTTWSITVLQLVIEVS